MGDGSVRLEVVAGKAAGMSIMVDGELVIGRHAEGAGRLADDEEISRSHARVSVDGSGFCGIEDLGSTNGTFVNGLRITSPQTLTEGDAIELGATTLVVRELPSQASDEEEATQPQPTIVPDVTGQGVIVAAEPQEPVRDVSQPTPVSAREPQAAGGLSLHLDIDFDAREARLRLDETGEVLRLALDGGSWRARPPGDGEGSPST